MVTRQYEMRAAGDFKGAVQAARKLLAGHGAEAIALDGRQRRILALLNLGIAETWMSPRTPARSTLENALSLTRREGNDYLLFCVLCALALLEALNGELRRSAQLANEAVALGESFGWMRLPAAAQAGCALAICSYHWNDLVEAGAELERASTAADRSLDPPVDALIQLVRALVAIREGDGDAAGLAIQAAKQDGLDWDVPPELAMAIASTDAEALVAAGRSTEAAAAIETVPDRSCGEGELVRARLALADGDPKESSNVSRGALVSDLPSLQPATAIELEVVAAVATHQRGDDEMALDLIEEALGLADVEHYVSPFVAAGAPLRELIVRRIRMGTGHRALAGELAEMLDPHAENAARGHVTLVLEPLSAREKAVLRYLPTDLSNSGGACVPLHQDSRSECPAGLPLAGGSGARACPSLHAGLLPGMAHASVPGTDAVR
jgi:LuxR family maltose regulon positive regulatory protein